jgi:hypothetical protein
MTVKEMERTHPRQRAERTPPKPRPSRKPVTGICAVCARAETCAYLLSSSAPVLQCEEFQAFPAKRGPEPMEQPLDLSRMSEEDAGESLGLCANCAKRKTCAFPKPPGGVWQCEEYE